jgi:hypothetical protein
MTESEKSESSGLPVTSELETQEVNQEIITFDESHRHMELESDSSVSAKARESTRALRELIMALASKTKETAIIKTQEFKDAANDERPEFEQDAADIQRLGNLVDRIAESFDNAMDTIRTAPYDEQARLFQGLKKLLSEEINVINARLSMASRLTFIQGQAAGTPTESA